MKYEPAYLLPLFCLNIIVFYIHRLFKLLSKIMESHNPTISNKYLSSGHPVITLPIIQTKQLLGQQCINKLLSFKPNFLICSFTKKHETQIGAIEVNLHFLVSPIRLDVIVFVSRPSCIFR